jgi:competence protein ComEC
MVERGKAGGRTQVWPPQTEMWRRRGPAFTDRLARFAGNAAGYIKEWSLADVGPGRLVPWLPVAFGLGIIVYFAAEQEPAWWAGLCLGLATAVVAIVLRARPSP